jgi:hypothetical protein
MKSKPWEIASFLRVKKDFSKFAMSQKEHTLTPAPHLS